MRYLIIWTAFFFLITGCKKDKFTTVPQVTFKSFKPDSYKQGTTDPSVLPVMILHVTDAEGDLGFITGKDTSFVYIRNVKTNKLDSLKLPNISTAAQKNFEGDIEINMKQYLVAPVPSKKDTLYYDVYVRDFAKNKSNIIRTDKPVYYFP
jgi:hypothetical protein